jgi:hypothetical protein
LIKNLKTQSSKDNKCHNKIKIKNNKLKIRDLKDKSVKVNQEHKINKYKLRIVNNPFSNKKNLNNKKRNQKIKNNIILPIEERTINLLQITTSKMIQINKIIKLETDKMINKEIKIKDKKELESLFTH